MARNIKARRKLADLYKRGVEVRFGEDGGHIAPFVDDDGNYIPITDDEVSVWVTPPSPLMREQALRDAQAARARASLAAKRNPESTEHLTALSFLSDMDDETLIDYVLMTDSEGRTNEAIRDVLAEDEWQDITSYQDAMRQFEEDKTPDDDPEYVALMEKDQRYGDQVSARSRELTDAAREVLHMLGRPEVERKALEKRSEIVGSQAFMAEYERQMLHYSCRDPEDRTQYFFESARDLHDQADAVQDVLKEALMPFISEGVEAKNSPGAASGSAPSDPLSKPETSESSTPTAVSA